MISQVVVLGKGHTMGFLYRCAYTFSQQIYTVQRVCLLYSNDQPSSYKRTVSSFFYNQSSLALYSFPDRLYSNDSFDTARYISYSSHELMKVVFGLRSGAFQKNIQTRTMRDRRQKKEEKYCKSSSIRIRSSRGKLELHSPAFSCCTLAYRKTQLSF